MEGQLSGVGGRHAGQKGGKEVGGPVRRGRYLAHSGGLEPAARLPARGGAAA